MTSRDMTSGRGIPTYETAKAADRPVVGPGDEEVTGDVAQPGSQWLTVPPGQPQQPN